MIFQFDLVWLRLVEEGAPASEAEKPRAQDRTPSSRFHLVSKYLYTHAGHLEVPEAWQVRAWYGSYRVGPSLQAGRGAVEHATGFPAVHQSEFATSRVASVHGRMDAVSKVPSAKLQAAAAKTVKTKLLAGPMTLDTWGTLRDSTS